MKNDFVYYTVLGWLSLILAAIVIYSLVLLISWGVILWVLLIFLIGTPIAYFVGAVID